MPGIIMPRIMSRLTVLVVANNDTMQQKHPSGMTKREMAEKAINALIEGRKQSYLRRSESFARVECGTGLTGDAMETAYYIALAWRNLQKEGGLSCPTQVFLLTDGSDERREKTRQIVDIFNKNRIPLYVYHLPSESNPMEGYDYCVSSGHTHSLVDIDLISAPFCLDDIHSLGAIFTGFDNILKG